MLGQWSCGCVCSSVSAKHCQQQRSHLLPHTLRSGSTTKLLQCICYYTTKSHSAPGLFILEKVASNCQTLQTGVELLKEGPFLDDSNALCCDLDGPVAMATACNAHRMPAKRRTPAQACIMEWPERAEHLHKKAGFCRCSACSGIPGTLLTVAMATGPFRSRQVRWAFCCCR